MIILTNVKLTDEFNGTNKIYWSNIFCYNINMNVVKIKENYEFFMVIKRNIFL